jgi:hypothetical protein
MTAVHARSWRPDDIPEATRIALVGWKAAGEAGNHHPFSVMKGEKQAAGVARNRVQ